MKTSKSVIKTKVTIRTVFVRNKLNIDGKVILCGEIKLVKFLN